MADEIGIYISAYADDHETRVGSARQDLAAETWQVFLLDTREDKIERSLTVRKLPDVIRELRRHGAHLLVVQVGDEGLALRASRALEVVQRLARLATE